MHPSTTLDAHTQRDTNTNTRVYSYRTESNDPFDSTRLDAPDRRLPLVWATHIPQSVGSKVDAEALATSDFFWIAYRPTTFFTDHNPSIRVPPHRTMIANLENTVSDTSHEPMKKCALGNVRRSWRRESRIANRESDRIRSVLKSNNILMTASKRLFFLSASVGRPGRWNATRCRRRRWRGYESKPGFAPGRRRRSQKCDGRRRRSC